MSPSMFLGRVALPGLALGIAALVGYEWSRTGRVELPSWSAETTASPKPLPAAADAPRAVVAQGRVVPYPGARVAVGAEVAGTVVKVAVSEKSAVRKGDLLVALKSDEAKAQLDEAASHLAEAEAEVARVEADERKLQANHAKGLAQAADVERTHSYVVGYRARRDALKAARVKLEAQWRRHFAYAPIDGVVIRREVQPGETVEASAPLVTIVDLNRLRVEAEVDEYDLARCAVGSSATLRAEAFPGRSWTGRVEEVADALVPRRLRPEDPGRPTDTSVLPVRITLPGPTPLKLGQRVEVVIAPGTPRPSSSSDSDPAVAAGPRRAASRPE